MAGGKIGEATILDETFDLNNLTTPGLYSWMNSVNQPFAWGFVEVKRVGYYEGEPDIVQIAQNNRLTIKKTRVKTTIEGWSEWK